MNKRREPSMLAFQNNSASTWTHWITEQRGGLLTCWYASASLCLFSRSTCSLFSSLTQLFIYLGRLICGERKKRNFFLVLFFTYKQRSSQRWSHDVCIKKWLFHLTPTRIATIKKIKKQKTPNKQKITSVGKGVEKLEPLCTVVGTINSAATM